MDDETPAIMKDHKITDLRKCFSSFKRDFTDLTSEVVFFYKISGDFPSPFTNAASE